MNQDRVRWGILGTGMVAGWLKKGLEGCSKSELVAVASRTAEKAQAFAAEHEVPSAYGAYEELLQDERIQAVILALPNTIHREWAEKAADAGKHVLCEKPIAMAGADADAMAAACRERGVHLMEAAMYRFQPQIGKVLELVAAGRIGPVRLVQAAFCFPFSDRANIRLKKAMGGGCLFDLGFYPVSFALLAAGCRPSYVFGSSYYGESDVDEATAAALHFPQGISAVAECAFRADIKLGAEIAGETGRIKLPDPWTARGTKKEVEVWEGRELTEKFELEDPNAYTLEIDHFADVIRGESAPLWTIDQSLDVIRTLEAIAQSARIQESVHLGKE